MAARSVWKGFIRFALVSIPVKAYTATASGGGSVTLNQLHRECGSRIKYQKTCPQHGEVAQTDIVSGYQFEPDQYVIIDPADLEKLRSAKDKAINITAFIKPESVDPVYYSGRTLYLVPDGSVGFKPYDLLMKAMVEKGRYAFATVVFGNKDQIVLLRPSGGLLAMSFLSFASEVRAPSEFTAEVPTAATTPAELKMARMLTDAMASDDFDFTSYKDTYNERLMELVRSKVEGKQLVTPPSDELQPVPDLMKALQQSLASTQDSGKKQRPAKLAAPSKSSRPADAARRRKTS
jgi:DNA end-binding protein Ku